MKIYHQGARRRRRFEFSSGDEVVTSPDARYDRIYQCKACGQRYVDDQ